MPTRSRLPAAIALAGVVSLAGCAKDTETGTPEPTLPSSTTQTTEETAAGIDAPVAGYVPAPTDFALEVIILKEKCFGSAGCNVTFTLKVSYLGARTPDPNRTFTAIYDVAGGSDPLTNRFTIMGDQVSMQSEEFVQTDSPDAMLSATVTQTL